MSTGTPDPLTPTILLLHGYPSSSGTGHFALATAAGEIQLVDDFLNNEHNASDTAQQNRGPRQWAKRCRVRPFLWWGKGVELPAL